jgi:hypothetical protein
VNKRWLVFAKNGAAFRDASSDNDFVMNILSMSTISRNSGLVALGRGRAEVLSVLVYEPPAGPDHSSFDSSKGKTPSGDLRARANTVTIALEEILSQDLPIPHGGINE